MVVLGGSMKYFRITLFLIFTFLFVFGCGTGKKSSDIEEEPGLPTSERIEELKEMVEDEPNNLDFRMQLAEAYQEQGRNMDALRTLEDGKQMDPSNADLKYSIAALALKMGDKRKCIDNSDMIHICDLRHNDYSDYSDLFDCNAVSYN